MKKECKKEEPKPHSFCETPEEKCTMNYCDENGCQNRKRELVEPQKEPKKYKCTECHWLGVFNEMKNEQDIDYDQYCCPKCNNVIYDCRFDKWYLEEEPKQETLEEAQKQQFNYDNLHDAKEIASKIKIVETLEEAAINNYKELYEGEPLTQDVPIDAFKQGAKWQQERMYSEEDMRKAYCRGYGAIVRSSLNDCFYEWFEQFKKK
jgi:hypothetical protein